MRNIIVVLLVAIAVLTSISGCDKGPFDPRNKYAKEWEMDFVIENLSGVQEDAFSKVAEITSMGNDLDPVYTGWGIYIDNYGCSIDRDGNIYSLGYNSRNPGGTRIGEISRKEFSVVFNDGGSLERFGRIVKITGTKK
jgi:hypothetical protein